MIRANRNLKIGATVVALVSAFGFLMRDCVNFGKIEGDTRPSKIAKAEEKAGKEIILKFGNLEVGNEESLYSGIYSAIMHVDSFREEIKLCEDRKIVSDRCLAAGNFDGALMNLNMILTRLNIMSKEAEKLSKSQVPIQQFGRLLEEMIELLKQDVSMEIAKLKQKKAGES